MMNTKYSKEVLKHFQKPKNMGSLKNPDGIGKLGNPSCLIPETKIHTKEKLIIIKELTKDNYVMTHKGRFKKITEIFKRNYTDKILKIKNKLGITEITPEHLTYAIKVPKKSSFRRIKNKSTKLFASWYHANDLEKGDVILYPILKEEKDIKYIDTPNIIKKYDFRSIKIPSKIPINNEFLRLIGYYISEGYYQDKISRTKLMFCFNIKEDYLADDVINITKKIFKINAIKKINEKKNTQKIEINNVWIVRLFKQLFGKTGALNKKIPLDFMYLPIEKQKSLIYGIWHGDGHFNQKKPRAGYSTISKELSQQLKILLLRQKIIPSIYYEKEKNIKNINHKECYRIHIGDRQSLKNLAKILKIKFTIKKQIAINSWFNNDYLFVPITEITKNKYSGKVYNLEIKEDHTYLTESLTVHNCGDVMQVQIKVIKDKKTNQEIIKDVKFQTMGCAAAIATSSMITEIAKGKTLEQALKITNKDVADKLGGLPPIKMHCSNLAAETLHEAIKDYYVKNKKIKPNNIEKKDSCYRCCE
jgi:NifU-like protein involved in Fe-S cluster formation